MKTTAMVCSVLFVLAFAGCNDLSAPQTTVADAYKALMRGDSAAFQGNLTGAALTAYAKPDSEGALKQRLTGLNLYTGEEQTLSSVNEGDGTWLVKEAVPVYSRTEVAGTETHTQVLMTELSCEITESPLCLGSPTELDPSGECQQYNESCLIDSIQF